MTQDAASGSELPVPSNLGQLHDGSRESAGSGDGSGRERSGMQYRGLRWPPDDDHSGSFVGLDQLDQDRVGSVDLTGGLPNASHWVHHDEAERVIQLLTDFSPPPSRRGLTKGLRRAVGARAEVVDRLGILNTTHPRSRDARPRRVTPLQEALSNSGVHLPQPRPLAGWR
jgi:hypothetical protein